MRDSARPTPPLWIALAVFALGLVVAPRVYHNYDVVDCFLAWARATKGAHPADAYTPGAGADDCDYPPLVPYFLAAAEGARLVAEAPAVSGSSILLLKLPNLLAALLLVPTALTGLLDIAGAATATRAALFLALSPALFVNAALWGQFDVLLALFLLAAVIALVRDEPLLAGAAMGLALATKVLAIVPVPILAAYAWRRLGWKAVLRGALVSVLVVAALALPHVIAGRGRAALQAYTGAVGYYPYRTAEAYNTWFLLDRIDVLARGLPPPEVRRDDRPAIGPMTFHHIGLLAFGAATLLLVRALWRRPTPTVFLWCVGLQLFAFFMLPTQVHQRYIVPAVAVLALVAPLSRRGLALFAGVSLTATLNQLFDLLRALPVDPLPGALGALDFGLATRTARDLGAAIAVVNLLLFVGAGWAFAHETPDPDPPA
jgi:4-amino-4-deoxy-L-arabinose transferase-like glycosyltransferase